MENEALADWQLGTSMAVAAFWVILWYLGRPLLRLMKIIGRFIARIAAAIRRFFQPIFEFLYRSGYIIFHIITVAALGFIALMPLVTGDQMDMLLHAEAGLAAIIVAGLTYIVFRHFLKYPLRAGQAQHAGNALGEADADALEEEFEFDIEI